MNPGETETQWSIDELIWHGPRMSLVDRVVSTTGDGLTAEVRIEPGRPFFESGAGVPAWVGVEYMAQAVAIFAGYRAKINGRKIPRGMIIGCRNYTTTEPVFSPGRVLSISVQELLCLNESLSSYDCEIRDMDLIASARITVFGDDS